MLNYVVLCCRSDWSDSFMCFIKRLYVIVDVGAERKKLI
jgi:hypothetical protein